MNAATGNSLDEKAQTADLRRSSALRADGAKIPTDMQP